MQPSSPVEKTFEIRKNDRGFQAGDTVKLQEWDPELNNNNGAWVTLSKDLVFKIGYVLPIDADRVVFSLIKGEGL